MLRGALGRGLFALVLVWAVIIGATPAVTAQEPEAGQATASQINGTPLVPGSTAIVKSDGDCLRLRDQPSLNGNRVNCIPDGLTVLVLPNVTEADGYRWQLVNWRGITGWVADQFLAPYDGPPVVDHCQSSIDTPLPPAAPTPSPVVTDPPAPSIPTGITGDVPSQGGFGLVVWGGGTVGGVETAARAQDCLLTSVWTSRPGGGFIGYRFGAPAFVNREWSEAVSESIGAGTPLLLVCDPPSSSTPISVRSIAIEPAASAQAPRLVGMTAAPKIKARAAVVIDEASGQILYDHNAHMRLAPASLTKIVTAILALEGSSVDDWVAVNDVDWRNMPGSSIMGLIPGDCFTVRDLLYGLMLPSGNDAALALARHVAGSDEAFVAQMNALAQRLGLQGSTFTDPHGLGSSGHLTSAYDIAMFSRYAMTQFPLFREIVATRSWTADGNRQLSMRNVNSFLGQFQNADGVKTGYTEQAGRTLSASATRNGQRLYAVILNDDDRYEDAEKLLDWAFDNYAWQ